MSINTNQRLNADQLIAALQALAPGSGFSTEGALPNTNGWKTITAQGATDAQLTSAIATAAGQFVDYDANRASLVAKAQTALTNNQTFLAIGSPTTAQAITQVQALTRQVNALIYFALQSFSSTAGT